MASKKYSLLAGFVCLLASYTFAQTTTTTGSTGGYDVADSSVIPARRMPQHTEFMNGTYNYPARPRNQWEIGLHTGIVNVIGDVDSKITFPSFGLSFRKALGYLFSLRLNYLYGQAKGRNWQPGSGYRTGGNASPWTRLGYNGGAVFYNYKTQIHDLALEGIFSLNNIRFNKSRVGTNFYVLVGAGGMIFDAMINAQGANGQRYTFANALNAYNSNSTRDSRSAINDALDAEMDDTYETDAENERGTRPTLFGWSFRPTAHVGVGVAFKLSDRFNIAIEDRVTFTGSDLLDGQRWAEQPSLTRAADAYNYLSVRFNINLGRNAVQPLWWLNPLDYAYQEIRKPRLMQLPKPVLPDTDGDGVTDQFDMEQTPAGTPVDSHGVSLDTDGDGVPDSRDKEKITPTRCQPVDADGVGKCPVQCPDSTCAGWTGGRGACEAALGALPSVTFSGSTVALSNDARGLLASVAARLRNNPECRIVVTGYCSSSKAQQQRSWDRVNAVITYMVEKEGINADRFYWNYGQEGGDCNTIDLRAAAADEQGQTTVPAPHPSLRGRR